jgi:hypothetical protein
MLLNADMQDLASANKALNKYNLTLTLEERPIKMLVLKEGPASSLSLLKIKP